MKLEIKFDKSYFLEELRKNGLLNTEHNYFLVKEELEDIVQCNLYSLYDEMIEKAIKYIREDKSYDLENTLPMALVLDVEKHDHDLLKCPDCKETTKIETWGGVDEFRRSVVQDMKNVIKLGEAKSKLYTCPECGMSYTLDKLAEYNYCEGME